MDPQFQPAGPADISPHGADATLRCPWFDDNPTACLALVFPSLVHVTGCLLIEDKDGRHGIGCEPSTGVAPAGSFLVRCVLPCPTYALSRDSYLTDPPEHHVAFILQ